MDVRLPDVVPLATATKNYAWGSSTAIPTLLGDEPTGTPVAELWIGAHPGAPSRWADDPGAIGLDALIAADPVGTLGAATAERFGGRLPFLLKLLAAEQALSLQVHPDLAQARAGFARENAAGIPVGSSERNYQDDNHKPELLFALTPFDALCGFRPAADTVDLLRALDTPVLHGLATLVRDAPDLRAAMEFLLALDVATAARWVADTTRAAQNYLDVQPVGRHRAEAGWAVRLAAQCPAEIGPVVALLLNLVRLEPGQSVFLAAGQIHAYLSGFGVEILANSDNVLRCGLTPKHVDAAELLHIATFTPATPDPGRSRPGAAGETVYPVPVPDFELSRYDLADPDDARGGVTTMSAGPQLVLATAGEVAVRGADGSATTLRPGRAAFVPAGRAVTVAGPGELFRSVVRLEI